MAEIKTATTKTMSAGAQIDWQNDPGFQQLPIAEKHKALLAIDPGYKALPPQEQTKALKAVHYGSDPEGMPENYGFTAENMFSKAWSGVKELGSSAATMGKDVLFPEGKSEGDKLSWLAHKYIFDPSDVEMRKAQTAKTGWESVGHSVAGAIPLVGPWAASLGEEAGTGDIGGAAARAGAQVGAAKLVSAIPGKAAALASKAKEGIAPVARQALGVGPEFTEQAVKDYQAKAGEVSESNKASLLRSRSEHEGKVGEIEQSNLEKRQTATQDFQDKWSNVEQQNKQALSKARQNEVDFQSKVEAAKQANESTRQTAVEKQQLQTEALGHAKELSEHLPQLKEQEKAFAKSLYPEVEGTAPASEMQGKIQDAIDTNMRGTDKPPAALSRIVKELGPEDVTRSTGPTVGGRHMDLSNPSDLAAFQRLKAGGAFTDAEIARMEGSSGPSGLSFEQLHGYYSELGEELSKDLAGDERASVTQARSAILDQMRKMAESQNKLTQFVEAQKNWGKYENTFNKTWNDKRGVASPIAKALNAKDPVTGEMLPDRVAQVLSKDQNYKLAQQMLSRYQGGKPELLQLMKEKLDQAGGMPKSIKETPVPGRSFAPLSLKTPPEMPDVPQKALPESQSISLKAAPEIPDIQGMKADAIKKKMEGLGGFQGRGMFIDAAALVHFLTTGNPIALSIPIGRRLLAKAIKSGAERGSLVGVTPEEAAMIKSIDQSAAPKKIPPSQVFPTKAAAAKVVLRGNRPTTLPEWESEDEAARRGAPGINPKLKALRRHFEKDAP